MKLSRTWIDKQLNHKQRTQLVDWLMEHTSNPTGDVILRGLGELFPEFSDELPSVQSCLAWKNANWPTELERCRLRHTNDAAAILSSAGVEKVGAANRALLQAQIFDELQVAQASKGDPNAPDLGDLVLAHARLQKLDQNDRKLDQDERKLALLEAKAARADEAESTTKDTSLTPDQKEAKLKAIFGIQA